MEIRSGGIGPGARLGAGETALRKRNGKQQEVFRITQARQGLAEDVRGRQRRYVISMSLRTVSVVVAAALWNTERHVAVVALVLSVVLPYVAVVVANAGRETPPGLDRVTAPLPPVRPALLPGEPGAGAPGRERTAP